jgi:dihydrofolate synthase/folylpolyglutamate synthase
MNYQEVLRYLDALQMHKIKLGLEAMQSFLGKVGRPETRLRFVHLAGTNGKGSVCAALSEIFSRAGYRVGVYTSPHLSSVRERFKIADNFISEADFAQLGSRICQVLGEEQITYFEFTTALGLLWFEQAGVDLVLLETGMGGRLDATNVVTPLVSVITSVSMDHEAYLGSCLAEIAAEKAGIIKAGVPVVSAAIDHEVAPVIKEMARNQRASLYSLGEDFTHTTNVDGSWDWKGGPRLHNRSLEGLKSNSPSLVQQENESLAIAALQLLDDLGLSVAEKYIYQGLAALRWPGRMEYFELPEVGEEKSNGRHNNRKIRYLLDGAHNPAGVANLVGTLENNYSRNRIIGLWGSMLDKDLTATLAMVVPLFDSLILTRPEGERSASPVQIFELLDGGSKKKALCITEVAEALEAAREQAGDGDLVVVGGSLYLVGAVRRLLLGELV